MSEIEKTEVGTHGFVTCTSTEISKKNSHQEEPVVPQEAPALAPSAPGAMAVMEAPAAGGDDDDDDDDQVI